MTRKHAYVVGYAHDRHPVYGQDDHWGKAAYLKPLTRSQAEAALKRWPMLGKRVAMWKLVLVKSRVTTREDNLRYHRRLVRMVKKGKIK